jgi:hypothetical protein
MCGANGNCRTSCTSDTHCATGYVCNTASSTCVAVKALGKVCGGDTECDSGNCVDGVCCGTAACTRCQSCAMPGSLGTCSNVNDGDSDPTGTCHDQGAIGCGTTGKCDDQGNCRHYGGSTKCASASCTGDHTLSPDRFCDGQGNCDPGTTTDCGAYGCNSAALACFASCNDDTSCASGNVCDTASMSCGPPAI